MEKEKNVASRRNKPLFLTIIGVIIVALITIFLFTNDFIKKGQESSGEVQDVPMYELSIADFEALFPDWTYVDHRDLVIDGKHFIAVLKEQSIDEYEKVVKVAVISFDASGEQWNIQWESDKVDAFDYGVANFIVINPANDKVAIVAFEIPNGGTSGASEVNAYAIDSEGIGSNLLNSWGYSIEEEEKQLIVYEDGKTVFSIEDGEVVVKQIPRSEVASDDAKKAYFTLDSRELVVPKDEKVIYVNEGESVAVVPANNREKLLFDQQSIILYTGQLFTESPYEKEIYTANANMVRHGNEITFTEKGVHYIYLEYYNGGYYEEEATFYVIVGDMEEYESKHQYTFKIPKEFMNELVIEEEETATVIYYKDAKFLNENVFLMAIDTVETDLGYDYGHPFASYLAYEEDTKQLYLLETPGESPYVMYWYNEEANNLAMLEQSERYHEIFDKLVGIVEISFKRNN